MTCHMAYVTQRTEKFTTIQYYLFCSTTLKLAPVNLGKKSKVLETYNRLVSKDLHDVF